MEQNAGVNFNQQLRDRTFKFSVEVHNLLQSKKISQTNRSTINQLLRCSSSVAANFRSATRARSTAEYYSKICVVTEECDETQFWLNYMLKTNSLTNPESELLLKEADELVRLFSTIKKRLKEKLESSRS